MKRFLVSLSGYDHALVVRLFAREQRFFVVVGALCLLSSLLVGAGAGYGAMLSFNDAVGVVIGGVFGALVLNLYRLLHAGTGYPVHRPIEEIDHWRPGKAPALVMGFLGVLIAQPLVILLLKAWIDPIVHNTHAGLIARTHAAWTLWPTVWITLFISAWIAMPAWLRIWLPNAVRAYERERWIEDRILVDDAYAGAQDEIVNYLDGLPGFVGLEQHYADPPYNTKPLIYGLAPELIETGSVRFVQGKVDPETQGRVPITQGRRSRLQGEKEPEKEPEVAPQKPDANAPVSEPRPAPTPEPPPPPRAPPPAEVPPAAGGAEEVQASWDDPSHDADPNPPPLVFYDIGRLQLQRAKKHVDVAAPFIARFTGIEESVVRGMIQNAPDDTRVHRLFGDYKKLRSILMKDARFALDHGLAPVVSIITQKPVADVEKRMRAAPPDKRLTGVFAPELARRLLNKKFKGGT